MTPLCKHICPCPFFEATPRVPPPDPRLKPGPVVTVFAASGGVRSTQLILMTLWNNGAEWCIATRNAAPFFSLAFQSRSRSLGLCSLSPRVANRLPLFSNIPHLKPQKLRRSTQVAPLDAPQIPPSRSLLPTVVPVPPFAA